MLKSRPPVAPPPVPPVLVPTVSALFLGFLEVALCSFGGAAPWARWVVVERRRWLTEEGFLEALNLCQILPGANVGNLSVHLGARFRGVPGALAAFSGLMVAPVVIAIGLDGLYWHFSHVPAVRNGVAGVSAAAAGLVIGTGIRMVGRGRTWVWCLVAAIALLTVGGLHWPLLPVLALLAPCSLALVWWHAHMPRRRG